MLAFVAVDVSVCVCVRVCVCTAEIKQRIDKNKFFLLTYQ